MKDTVASKVDASQPEAVHKNDTSRAGRLLRLIGAAVDPRAWAHLVKIVNYYNYTHVAQVRQMTVGHDTRISPTAGFSNARNIHLHDRARISAGAQLWAGNGTAQIVVGRDTLIGPNVMVVASNYRFNDGSPINNQAMDEADIIIGDDVWLGTGAVVLSGARIGDGAIIGAGVTVRGDIPPRTVLSAAPPVPIGLRTDPNAAAPTSQVPSPAPSQATPLTATPHDITALILKQLPSLEPADLDRPLDASGIDSFDLISLRTAIEAAYNTHLPDAQWSGIETLADIAALPTLGPTIPNALRAEAPPAVEATAPTPTMSTAARSKTGLRRDYLVNMPQMALSGLSENWLFKELGDVHWDMVTHFLETPSAGITDDLGDRLYATFTRITLEIEPSLRTVRENDTLRVDADLSRFGASFFFGDHALASGDTRGTARTMSTFAKYGERGKNTSLMKGTPALPDPGALPSLETFPEFGTTYRARRGEDPADVIWECDYEILPSHDINGVGLLYFAAYPTIMDLCIERHEAEHGIGKGFLAAHSTTRKDICYFANSEPTETLVFRLHARDEADGLVHHRASLARKSDGVRMSEVYSTKRKL